MGKQTLVGALPAASGPVQRKATGAPAGPVQAIAAGGVAGDGGRLPYLEAIQRSFGRHDVSQIKAHTGGAASAATAAIGAEAYATGDRVAFGGAPSLHTAAHEAAHVVQQRAGVELAGGVGEVGDAYERHADEVAELVVRGESAESLLDTMAGGGGGATASQPVQAKLLIGGAVKREQVEMPKAARQSLRTSDPAVIARLEAWIKDEVRKGREFENWPAAAAAVVEVLRQEREAHAAYAKGDGRHDALLYDTLRTLAARWERPSDPTPSGAKASGAKPSSAVVDATPSEAPVLEPAPIETAVVDATPSDTPVVETASVEPASASVDTAPGKTAPGKKAAGKPSSKPDVEAQQALRRLLAVLHAFQHSYDAACAPSSSGLFEFDGRQFFVTHENNNYIVPAADKDSLAPSKPATSSSTTKPKARPKAKLGGKVDAEPSASADEASAIKKVSYTHGETFGSKFLRDALVSLILGKRLPCSDSQVALFLAGLAAEVRRNSVAQVTNLLLVGGLVDPTRDASAKINVFTAMPMTTGGTDDPDKERDRMLVPSGDDRALEAMPPKLVTDEEIGMLRHVLRGSLTADKLNVALDDELRKATSREQVIALLAGSVERKIAAQIKALLSKQVVALELDKLCSQKFIEDHVLGHARSKATTPEELLAHRSVADSTAIDLTSSADMMRFCGDVEAFMSLDGKRKLSMLTRNSAGYLVSHYDSKSKTWTRGFANVTITREDGTADDGAHRLINHFQDQQWIEQLSEKEYAAHKASVKAQQAERDRAEPASATGKPGASGGASDEPAGPQRRATYDSADGRSHLEAFETRGEGDCGIHAIAGALGADGNYAHPDQGAVRTQIAQRIRGGQVHVGRYRAMLTELLAEIHPRVAAGEAEELGGDQARLWTAFGLIAGLVADLDQAHRAEQRRAREQGEERTELVRQMAGFLCNAPQSAPLRAFLVAEVLRSNAESDQVMKAELLSIGDALRPAHVAQHAELRHMVDSNLQGLMNLAQHMGMQHMTRLAARHQQYTVANADAQPIYPAVVLRHEVPLRNAYADVVEQQGYFLREEDMRELADIQQRGLILYREHDQHPDQYSQVVSHNPGNNPVHVFHTGGHYERSTLRQDG